MPEPMSEAQRLEAQWGGAFGDAYIARNRQAHARRGAFWQDILQRYPVKQVLEVGCNLGGNLRWIADCPCRPQINGVDINPRALEIVRAELPQGNFWLAPARSLPFEDGFCDLAFTCGVLIHQPQESLAEVMAEIVRCSRRYVLAVEYFAEATTEVAYRGLPGSLFKRDYGGLYAATFPQLQLLESGFLAKAEGWDDDTYWLFEKKDEG